VLVLPPMDLVEEIIQACMPGAESAYLEARPDLDAAQAGLPDLEPALDRLLKARRDGERVVVHGDYDVDGLMGATLLTAVLAACGLKIRPYIPSRFDGGYGLSLESLAFCRREGASLLITADCGTNALEVSRILAERNVDLIITDHHIPPEGKERRAAAVVNPQYAPRPLPLCGASVAGLAARSLARRLKVPLPDDSLLRLMAIGTLADRAQLDTLNRGIVRGGLDALARTPHGGLRALLRGARVSPPVWSDDVGFRVAPLLNAAGRMADAQEVVSLLLERDPAAATRRVAELTRLNRQRRETQQRCLADAMGQIREGTAACRRPVVLVHLPGGHPGVVGLVAQSLASALELPAFVTHADEGVAVGSARSDGKTHVTRILEGAAPFLTRFGGHAQAAGFTLPEEAIPALAEHLASLTELPPVETPPPPGRDVELREEWLGPPLEEAMHRLQPFGEGWPAPVFRLPRSWLRRPRPLGRNGHRSWRVKAGNGEEIPVLFFRRDGREEPPEGDVWRVSAGKNSWNGSGIQFVVQGNA